LSSAGSSLYIGDQGVVRKVSQATGGLTNPAGTGPLDTRPGNFGANGDGGPAAVATLFEACGVTTDQAGNLLIADIAMARVRVLAAKTGTFYGQAMQAGNIYTVAGHGLPGLGGSGVPATRTQLSSPDDVTVDPNGNLVIDDGSIAPGPIDKGAELRVVAATTGTFYGQAMKAGDIYTVAGSRSKNHYSGDGGLAVKAGLSTLTGAVRIDQAGNLVFADSNAARIRVVAVRTGAFYGQAMQAGHIYTVAGDGRRGFSGDGGVATKASMYLPYGLTIDPAGNLVIADSGNNRIRVVAAKAGTFYGKAMTAGHIYTIAGDGTAGSAGDGGPPARAELDLGVFSALALDGAGNLLIAANGDGLVRVVAASTGTFYGKAMKAGRIYTIAGTAPLFTGNGLPATSATVAPQAVTVNAAGGLLISENADIRMVPAMPGTFYGKAMKAGRIYLVAGTGAQGFSGDGGPAVKARMNGVEGLAVDAAGNLVISDSSNNRIRVVAAGTGTFYGRAMITGHIYTVAGTGKKGFSGDGGPAAQAELWSPTDVAVDAAGNLVISDSINRRVRVVAATTGTFYGQAMTAGHIYTVAGTGKTGFSGDGGPATKAELDSPVTTAVDATGNLAIADTFNNRIRVVAARTGMFYGQAMKAGDIYTVAGSGAGGFSGDGGPATSAALGLPSGVAVDATGNLAIADTDNDRIRVVAATTGTFYGQAMKVGDIYTVAGGGTSGLLGDGGPAAQAPLFLPFGPAAALDQAGNLLIADIGSDRIRLVSR
jgi:sugar lactone lactonase YvrE